jgi:uncharacterized membrane protein YkoI
MNMWKKVLPILALAVFLVPASVVVHAQSTATPSATINLNTDVNEQYPNYAGSIKVSENIADQQLAALAKISPDEAKASALKNAMVAGGTVIKVSLDNENGNLVYSVEIVKGTTSYDVKVDAGTGSILFIDQGIEDKVGTVENPEG